MYLKYYHVLNLILVFAILLFYQVIWANWIYKYTTLDISCHVISIVCFSLLLIHLCFRYAHKNVNECISFGYALGLLLIGYVI